MGLTKNAVGIKAIDNGLKIEKRSRSDKIIALAGNPNVGKSTLFNALTNMHQHTGNWPGKTVSNAQGYCKQNDISYVFVDIPGTYSLMAHSKEEEIARNFICFGNADAVVVVCDATCLERNLNLVLQTVEMYENVVVCINLVDEAERKGIYVDEKILSEKLGVPVVKTVARKKRTLNSLLKVLENVPERKTGSIVPYDEPIAKAVLELGSVLEKRIEKKLDASWLALRLLDNDESLMSEITAYLGEDILNDEGVKKAYISAKEYIENNGYDNDSLKEAIVSSVVACAHEISMQAVSIKNTSYDRTDRKIDKLLTGKWVGYPVMLALLALIFYITISGANYPSKWLAAFFFRIQDMLTSLFYSWNAPAWLHDALVLGVYRTLAWVVSVMLPPMAIFFPLFTLLEDAGYLPRVAYNLDRPFKCCKACGKQALTMCMGFGCNAAGIVGTRIIDSKRERLLAILTNSFVPCNGRFPAMISLITIFFVGREFGAFSNVLSALMLTAVILLGIAMTFAVTRILSFTLLKGEPSSFTLELPPYRRPQVLKVIVRSFLDRTFFVLGRAAAVAAPAGLIIWLFANITVGDVSILKHCSDFLDPFARLMGLDGVILLSFILGFPANEIVIPIATMAYAAKGSLSELSIEQMRMLLTDNGWTWLTALNTVLFSLMHWPCSTTLLTVKKETGSIKWTILAALIPTVAGILICMAVTFIAGWFS